MCHLYWRFTDWMRRENVKILLNVQEDAALPPVSNSSDVHFNATVGKYFTLQCHENALSILTRGAHVNTPAGWQASALGSKRLDSPL